MEATPSNPLIKHWSSRSDLGACSKSIHQLVSCLHYFLQKTIWLSCSTMYIGRVHCNTKKSTPSVPQSCLLHIIRLSAHCHLLPRASLVPHHPCQVMDFLHCPVLTSKVMSLLGDAWDFLEHTPASSITQWVQKQLHSRICKSTEFVLLTLRTLYMLASTTVYPFTISLVNHGQLPADLWNGSGGQPPA